MTKRKLSFEQALKDLEALTAQIEQGQIGLEESITKYEEGMSLVKQCRDMLTKAEQRIERIQQRADGTLETKSIESPQDS